jgi:hypothetical protein
MHHHRFSMPAIVRAIEASQTRDPQEMFLVLLARADARVASQNRLVTPMTDQEFAEYYDDRRFEALRVAAVNTVSLRLDQDQAAQVEQPQRAQRTSTPTCSSHRQRRTDKINISDSRNGNKTRRRTYRKKGSSKSHKPESRSSCRTRKNRQTIPGTRRTGRIHHEQFKTRSNTIFKRCNSTNCT